MMLESTTHLFSLEQISAEVWDDEVMAAGHESSIAFVWLSTFVLDGASVYLFWIPAKHTSCDEETDACNEEHETFEKLISWSTHPLLSENSVEIAPSFLDFDDPISSKGSVFIKVLVKFPKKTRKYIHIYENSSIMNNQLIGK